MPTPFYRYRITVVAPLARGEKVHQVWMFWLLAENEPSARAAIDQYCGWQITKRYLVTIEHSEPEKDSPRIFHEDNWMAEMPREVYAELKRQKSGVKSGKSVCTPEQRAALRTIHAASMGEGQDRDVSMIPHQRLRALMNKGLLKQIRKTGEYALSAAGRRQATSVEASD